MEVIPSFFRLPRELRDQVYGYVLDHPAGIVMIPRAGQTSSSRTFVLPEDITMIFKASRQLYTESRSFLFKNTFNLEEFAGYEKFQESDFANSRDIRKEIKHITLSTAQTLTPLDYLQMSRSLIGISSGRPDLGNLTTITVNIAPASPQASADSLFSVSTCSSLYDFMDGSTRRKVNLLFQRPNDLELLGTVQILGRLLDKIDSSHLTGLQAYNFVNYTVGMIGNRPESDVTALNAVVTVSLKSGTAKHWACVTAGRCRVDEPENCACRLLRRWKRDLFSEVQPLTAPKYHAEPEIRQVMGNRSTIVKARGIISHASSRLRLVGSRATMWLSDRS